MSKISKKAWAVLDPKHGIQEIFLHRSAMMAWEDAAIGKFWTVVWKQKIIEIEIKYKI